MPVKKPSRTAGRPKTADRHTPLYDAWLDCFRTATEDPEARTAASQTLAQDTGTTPEATRVTVYRIRERKIIPTAETLLVLDRWLAGKSKIRTARATGK